MHVPHSFNTKFYVKMRYWKTFSSTCFGIFQFVTLLLRIHSEEYKILKEQPGYFRQIHTMQSALEAEILGGKL